MSPGRIEELFDCLEQKTSFQCSKQSDHPLAYLVEGDIELLGEFHPISISATYFGPRDKMVLYMHVCDGSYGAKSYLIFDYRTEHVSDYWRATASGSGIPVGIGRR